MTVNIWVNVFPVKGNGLFCEVIWAGTCFRKVMSHLYKAQWTLNVYSVSLFFTSLLDSFFFKKGEMFEKINIFRYNPVLWVCVWCPCIFFKSTYFLFTDIPAISLYLSLNLFKNDLGLFFFPCNTWIHVHY